MERLLISTRKKFPDEWSLQKLDEFVAADPTPEPNLSIGERLAEIAHVNIDVALRILSRMVRADGEGWRTYSLKSSTYAILERAMRETGDIRQEAEALIDYLGRRGYLEFGKLLPSTPPDTKIP